MSEPVILLHGIWMRAFSLVALRRRLTAAGFAPQMFEYASVMQGPDPSVARLLERVRALHVERLHLVGHSLGGLIALQAARSGDLPPGNIVCLGSPLSGSAAARGLSKIPGGATVMGRSADILRSGLDRWDDTRAVGSIAGTRPVGLGSLLGALRGEHDGTVSVDETRLVGIADHCVVTATHTGLLFSDQAARQVLTFLRDGRFASIHDTVR
jgi:pimeloyl-ACP methyl ester carboxylesterase